MLLQTLDHMAVLMSIGTYCTVSEALAGDTSPALVHLGGRLVSLSHTIFIDFLRFEK